LGWFFSKIKDLFTGVKDNPEFKLEFEKILYDADLSSVLVEKLSSSINKTNDINEIKTVIEQRLTEHLEPYQCALEIEEGLNVVLLVGVNGVGKTTVAAKLANLMKNEYKKKVMLAGADTFRAAGVDQLEHWSQKIACDFFSKGPGADPGAVAYESVSMALQKGTDVLIIDTGGRLHTQIGLMSEISKTKKAVSKALGKDPQHVVLVIDSTQGQNIKNQAELFTKSLDINGIILTKFDGTSKGGALFGAIDLVKKPVFYVCTGEKLENISEFNAKNFVHKIL